MKVKYPLEKAEEIASRVIEHLDPVCERIEIAGSIRRRKPQVGDIEIVCVPKLRQEKNLFGEVIKTVSLVDTFDFSVFGTKLVKSGSRFKQVELKVNPVIHLDLFIVMPPAQWGVIFTQRTGSSDFSHWLMSSRNYGGGMPSQFRVKDGALHYFNRLIPTPEEIDFFNAIGVPYIEPEKREPMWNAELPAAPIPALEA